MSRWVVVGVMVSTTALGQVKPCEDCWTDACTNLKGVVKKCPASAAPTACPAGQVKNEDTDGNCCWPGQGWKKSEKRCIGAPQCPSGLVASGEKCVAAAKRPARPSLASQEEQESPAPRAAEPARSCPSGMAWIPGGSFTMGQRGDTVTVKGFCLDVTEVTVAACARRATARTSWNDGTTEKGEGEICNGNKPDRQSHPVNCIDWNEATAYCEAVGKRLPTEEEWEWAARGGPKGWQYPWGNSAPGNKACWDGQGNTAGEGNRQSTCAVGAFRAGANPQGVQDLAGNVWEWTSSKYEANSPARVYRGGSWSVFNPELLRASFRYRDSPSGRGYVLGFRCARTP